MIWGILPLLCIASSGVYFFLHTSPYTPLLFPVGIQRLHLNKLYPSIMPQLLSSWGSAQEVTEAEVTRAEKEWEKRKSNGDKPASYSPYMEDIDIFETYNKRLEESDANFLASGIDIRAEIGVPLNLSLHVFAWKRVKSLGRLLRSLQDADYGETKALTLIIHIDGGASSGVLELVSKFVWRYGEKIVEANEANIGLQGVRKHHLCYTRYLEL
jgi:hypothetical protein